MEKNQRIYRDDILNAISTIRRYINGRTEEEFYQDQLLQDAVVRQLEIVGEASNRLPDSYKKLTEKIPWTDISGMRNKIVHDYYEIDEEKVWLTILEDLPLLEQFLKEHEASNL